MNNIEAKELRLGNYIRSEFGGDLIVTPEIISNCHYGYSKYVGIPLTEEWLLRGGFTPINNKAYINGKQWLKQVSDDYTDDVDVINEDGTWFDGIGTFHYEKRGEMAVNVLCKGNYVCNCAKYVHQLQNIYFDLSGEELMIL